MPERSASWPPWRAASGCGWGRQEQLSARRPRSIRGEARHVGSRPPQHPVLANSVFVRVRKRAAATWEPRWSHENPDEPAGWEYSAGRRQDFLVKFHQKHRWPGSQPLPTHEESWRRAATGALASAVPQSRQPLHWVRLACPRAQPDGHRGPAYSSFRMRLAQTPRAVAHRPGARFSSATARGPARWSRCWLERPAKRCCSERHRGNRPGELLKPCCLDRFRQAPWPPYRRACRSTQLPEPACRSAAVSMQSWHWWRLRRSARSGAPRPRWSGDAIPRCTRDRLRQGPPQRSIRSEMLST